jgi:hypothetical protein
VVVLLSVNILTSIISTRSKQGLVNLKEPQTNLTDRSTMYSQMITTSIILEKLFVSFYTAEVQFNSGFLCP